MVRAYRLVYMKEGIASLIIKTTDMRLTFTDPKKGTIQFRFLCQGGPAIKSWVTTGINKLTCQMLSHEAHTWISVGVVYFCIGQLPICPGFEAVNRCLVVLNQKSHCAFM